MIRLFLKGPEIFLCSFFKKSGWCTYHHSVYSNFNPLHNFRLMPLPTQSYLVLYSFFYCFLHSFIIELTVSSLCLHYRLSNSNQFWNFKIIRWTLENLTDAVVCIAPILSYITSFFPDYWPGSLKEFQMLQLFINTSASFMFTEYSVDLHVPYICLKSVYCYSTFISTLVL